MRNVISGNGNIGIHILGSGAVGNRVEGNFIGTDVNGISALGNNQGGVDINGGASGNFVGGAAAGARNVISGNNQRGVGIGLDNLGTANNNTVQGNYIGLKANGNEALGNQFDGVDLGGGVTGNNVVGNVVSANGAGGISLFATGANNSILGNLVGTNAAGTVALGNVLDGVFLGSSSGNTIGGTSAAARNLMSGNRRGLVISDLGTFNPVGSSNNVVHGNFIGTNINGNSAIPNPMGGVAIVGASLDNFIGGEAAGERNVISGNTSDNIAVHVGASSNTIQGNFIGTDVTGTVALGGSAAGVLVGSGGAANNNIIGGTAAGAGNLISGNGTGIRITSGSTGTQIQGNLIGTDVTGTVALGNTFNGIIFQSGSNNTIGGTTVAARNVISGNVRGIFVSDTSSANNVIQGNYIGVNVSGTAALPNRFHGISTSGANTIIGGTAAGAGNVISGNAFLGVGFFVSGLPGDTGAAGSILQGNLIGTNAAGTAALGNGSSGVQVTAPGITIGGTTAAARNVISGNDDRHSSWHLSISRPADDEYGCAR